MKKDFKFYCGVTLLVYSLIPYLLTIIVIPFFNITGALLSGIGVLIISAEISFAVGIVLLGKTFIKLIKKKILSEYIFPHGPISKMRHSWGVGLFLGSFVPYFLVEIFLLFDLFSTHNISFLLLLLLGDFLFVLSLVVLGVEFWEKLKSLFKYDSQFSTKNKSI